MDIMVDIETLGTGPRSAIIQIGAMTFDRGKGALSNIFFCNVSLMSSLLAGLEMDQNTLDWWKKQSDGATSALDLEPMLPLETAMLRFHEWVRSIPFTTIWAKSPQFDLVILEHAFRSLGLTIPWKYNQARDVRTLLDIAGVKGAPAAHNALEDAKEQVKDVVEALDRLRVG